MKLAFNHPILYITLLSDIAKGIKTTHAVYSPTMQDEIAIRTPDILMTGQSTEQIIGRCCPSIDVSNLLISDIQHILASIKLAATGPMLELLFHCPRCDAVDPYEINLQNLIPQMSAAQWFAPLDVSDLTLTFTPPSYKSYNLFCIDNFRYSKQLYTISQMENFEDYAIIAEKLQEQQRHILRNFQSSAITSITPKKSKTVTDQKFISEWFSQCDVATQKKVTAYIDNCYEKCMLQNMMMNCAEEKCKAPFNVPINLDVCVQFRNRLIRQNEQDVIAEMEKMSKECKNLTNELLKMIWFMRGSISYEEAWHLTAYEKHCIGKIIEENIEISKKINHPII